MRRRFPTPHPDVNEILDLLLRNVRGILGDRLVGMYLYGSLSRGDFDLRTSDIDFLVVTVDSLPREKIRRLESMHRRVWASGLERASRLEGSYIPKSLVRRHDPDGAACPTINEGNFFMARPGSDWIIQRHIVREYGVTLAGPDPKTLIDPVAPEEIRGAVIGILNEWWFPMLEDSSWLREHGSHYHGYAVITMCRALHALQHETIVSKPVAVAWAKAELGSRWLGLIEQAVASQYGQRSEFFDETLEFIRFTRQQLANHEQIKGEGSGA